MTLDSIGTTVNLAMGGRTILTRMNQENKQNSGLVNKIHTFAPIGCIV